MNHLASEWRVLYFKCLQRTSIVHFLTELKIVNFFIWVHHLLCVYDNWWKRNMQYVFVRYCEHIHVLLNEKESLFEFNRLGFYWNRHIPYHCSDICCESNADKKYCLCSDNEDNFILRICLLRKNILLIRPCANDVWFSVPFESRQKLELKRKTN